VGVADTTRGYSDAARRECLSNCLLQSEPKSGQEIWWLRKDFAKFLADGQGLDGKE